MTMNGVGSFSVRPSTVTWNSCIDSSRALWTFGGARFISSASRTLVKTGPFLNSNSLSLRLKMNPPMMSSGRMSGVNWTLLNWSPTHFEKAFATSVLERPGTPSRRTCPLARRQVRMRSVSFSLPTTTFPTSLTTRSRISAPNARASSPAQAGPVKHDRDVADLVVVKVWEGGPAIPVGLVALEGALHRLCLHAVRPQARDGLLPCEACREVGYGLLQGRLQAAEGLAQVRGREPAPPEPQSCETQGGVEDDVQRQ